MKEAKLLIGICIYFMAGIIFLLGGVLLRIIPLGLIRANSPVLIVVCVAAVIVEVCGSLAIKEICRLNAASKTNKNKTADDATDTENTQE